MSITLGRFGKLDFGEWLYGLFAAFIGGGAGAVVAGVTVSQMDPKDYNLLTSKFYVLIGVVFLANGVLNMMSFLHQRPLPAIVPHDDKE